MAHISQRFLLGALTAGLLLLGTSARLGVTNFGSVVSSGRGLLQNDGREPCLFINGRIIPPCDQIDGNNESSPKTPPDSPPAESEGEGPTPDSTLTSEDMTGSEEQMPVPMEGDEVPMAMEEGQLADLMPAPAVNATEIGVPETAKVERNQTEILLECRLNGTLLAPEAAILACEALSKVCSFATNKSTSVTPLSDPGVFLDKIIEESCRTESIATCENKGNEFVDAECRSVLENGPAKNGTVCNGVKSANEIFEAEISLFCRKSFTPEEI